MDKNITRDVDEQNIAIALETEKTIKRLGLSFNPSAFLAVNIIKLISVATTIEYSEVSIIHFSAFVLNSSCVLANKT